MYVFRTFRAFLCRSVALYRSRNDTFTRRLTRESPRARASSAIVPKIRCTRISTTRPRSRRFSTVAYTSPGGGTRSGAIRRTGRPVGVVVTSSP